MLSNVFVFNAPWYQNGWDGTICPAPAENVAYCQKTENRHLIGMCEIMVGREHLDRSAATENQIQRGLEALCCTWPTSWQDPKISRHGSYTVWKKTPVVNLSAAPDPDYGRLHLSKGRWEFPKMLRVCRHLRTDPWCSPSLSLFKKRPSCHGLANQYTDDTFSFSVQDFQGVLQPLRKRPEDCPKPLYALICCKNNPVPTVDEDAIIVVGGGDDRQNPV